jgi:hypothetical protein
MKDGILGFLFSTWGWLSLAAILAGLEIVVPGAFLIWLAAAAAATALTVTLLNTTPDGQLGAFALWILLSLLAARRLKASRPIATDDPKLNRLALRVAGETAVVTVAIEGGHGRVRLGDTEWMAEGPDAPVGARVTVRGADGARLQVEPG